jgi:hypothetical protein
MMCPYRKRLTCNIPSPEDVETGPVLGRIRWVGGIHMRKKEGTSAQLLEHEEQGTDEQQD